MNCLSLINLIFICASSSQVCVEQMNEGDGSNPAREARKKKRGSGFRYSSKKDLERSKLKRAAKSRESDLASVTKALSYPCAHSSGCDPGSGGPLCLEIVREQDGDEKDLRQGNAVVEGDFLPQVSTIYLKLMHCFMLIHTADIFLIFLPPFSI
jgi:hypothetical protein